MISCFLLWVTELKISKRQIEKEEGKQGFGLVGFLGDVLQAVENTNMGFGIEGRAR